MFDARLEYLRALLDLKINTLDRTNQKEIDDLNQLVKEYKNCVLLERPVTEDAVKKTNILQEDYEKMKWMFEKKILPFKINIQKNNIPKEEFSEIDIKALWSKLKK